MGVEGGALETHVKAHGAAAATFWFVFHSFCPFEPAVAIVVGIDKGHAEFVSIAFVFFFAQNVLLPGVNVGVIEEEGGIDV